MANQIRVSDELKAELDELAEKKETYGETIWRMINYWKEHMVKRDGFEILEETEDKIVIKKPKKKTEEYNRFVEKSVDDGFLVIEKG